MKQSGDQPKIVVGARRRRGLRALGEFRSDESGSSALEFALVAIPLIILLLGILQVGIIYLGNLTLENATSQGARLIRTGQAQTQSFDATAFKQEVCEHLPPFLACSKLEVDVRHFTNFGGVQLTKPLDGNGSMQSNFSYEPGIAGDVVVVRAFYPWGLTAGFPSFLRMSNMADNYRLLIATVAFRNEPFKNAITGN